MDPFGFAFENFDGIGAYRTMDNGSPVDSTATVSLDGTKQSVANGVQLASLLSTSPEARQCFTTQWVRYALARPETDADKASIATAYTAFASSQLQRAQPAGRGRNLAHIPFPDPRRWRNTAMKVLKDKYSRRAHAQGHGGRGAPCSPSSTTRPSGPTTDAPARSARTGFRRVSSPSRARTASTSPTGGNPATTSRRERSCRSWRR